MKKQHCYNCDNKSNLIIKYFLKIENIEDYSKHNKIIHNICQKCFNNKTFQNSIYIMDLKQI